MSEQIRAIVILSEGANPHVVDSALGADPSIEVVGYSDSLDQDWQNLLSEQSDIVIVACESYSERAAHMIDRASKQRPDRPVVLMAQSSPNGLLRQAFESGADDVIALPQPPDAIRFLLLHARPQHAGQQRRRQADRGEEAEESSSCGRGVSHRPRCYRTRLIAATSCGCRRCGTRGARRCAASRCDRARSADG